jgi:hypothetical protein
MENICSKNEPKSHYNKSIQKIDVLTLYIDRIKYRFNIYELSSLLFQEPN